MPPETLSLKVSRSAAILFLPAWAGVVGGELGKGGPGFNIWDKMLHFSAYFILAGLAATALRSRRAALWAVLGLIAMGGILEIVQGFIGRDCDIHDEYANTLGAIAGALVGRAIMALLVRTKSEG